MKKFCMCLITLVVILFVGFSTYYIIRNDEDISYTVSDNDTIYMNVGETISSPIIHTHKAKGSKVAVTLSGNNVVYDEENNTFFAASAGSTTITAVPSNSNFAAISFTIAVGNGTTINPYYIRTEQDFASIGSDKFPLSAAYEIVSDINFTQDFTPIGSERQPFSGMLFGGEMMYKLSNINIVSESGLAGIFAALSQTASVERVTFENVTVDGSFSYAGTVTAINNGFIGQCVVTGSLKNTSTSGYTGGIVGKNGPNARVSTCTSDVSIEARNFAGGVAGKSEGGTVDNCLATTKARLSNGQAVFGGLTGENTFGTMQVGNTTKTYNSKYVNNMAILLQTGAMGKYCTLIGKSTALAGDLSSWTYFNMLLARSNANEKPIGSINNDYDVVDGGKAALNYYRNLTLTEFEDETSYTSPENSTWPFGEIWTLEEGVLAIDYTSCAGSYQDLPWNSSNKLEISSEQEALNALDLIRQFPQAGLEYTITEDIDIDFHGQTLAPIGSESKPFIGKVVGQEYQDSYDDPDTGETITETLYHTLTISNFVVESKEKYVGFFGAISGTDTLIQGLNFEGATISGQIAGVIAGFNNKATINECTIFDCIINSNQTAGGLVGINSGTIKSSHADVDTAYQASINLTSGATDEVALGGIAGQNSGNIVGVGINECHINLLENTDKTVNIGGIVGRQTAGNSQNCYTFNAIFNGVGFTSLGHVYSGGIVGNLQGGKIDKCFSTSLDCTLSISNGNTVAGGVAGFVGSDGTVANSLFHSGSMTAMRVGGIVGEIHGKLEKSACEISAILVGNVAAGLAADCYGTITNCYSIASLQGSEIEAGFVGTLNNGATVQFNYNYCAYNGTGKGYCETSTPFRSQNGNWKFVNNIVVGNKVGGDLPILGDMFMTKCTQRNAKEVAIQHKNNNKGTFVILTPDEAKEFTQFTSHGFNSEFWDIYGEGDHLSLRNLPIVNDGSEESVDEGGAESGPEGGADEPIEIPQP